MADPSQRQGPGVVGVSWPWSATGPQGVSDIELINSKISLVLFTFRGTHKMEPTFGSTLLSLVFESRGPILAQMADVEIRNSLETWISEIRILKTKMVDERDTFEGLVTIEVDYEYLGQDKTWSGYVGQNGSGGP